MAQSEQPKENTTQWSAKSGKGLRDGAVSELFTLLARAAGGAPSQPPEPQQMRPTRKERYMP